jgi:glycosidase
MPSLWPRPGRVFRFAGRFTALLTAVLLAACSSAGGPSSTPPAAQTLSAEAVKVVPQESWADSVLYFVILDRFADGDAHNNRAVNIRQKGTFHGGDLAGLRQQLDEIASLGATAIWITPVVDQIDGFVTGAGFPDWGYHGYWADDFSKVDPRFGTEAELKALVDDAHARGLKVILDVVYNHAGYDSKYVTDPRTSGWLRVGGSCGTDDLTLCVSGLPDFKTEQPEVADFVMKSQIERAKRVGLDGFRLDTVKHVDHSFWQEHRRRTREQVAENFFLVGEVWGGDAGSLDPWFAGDEMDAGFDFSFQGNVLGWLQGRGRTVAFDRYLKSREKVRQGYLLSQYLSSHDVKGALSILEGDRELFRLAALLQMTTQGMPTIFYGEEVGRPGGDWPDNRSDMPWGDRQIQPGAGQPRDEALREDYRRLIAIRRAHPALSRAPHTPIASEGDLLVFLRRDEASGASGDTVVVAINRAAAPATASFDAPAEWKDSPVRDFWKEEDVQRSGARIEITVGPKDARILGVIHG